MDFGIAKILDSGVLAGVVGATHTAGGVFSGEWRCVRRAKKPAADQSSALDERCRIKLIPSHGYPIAKCLLHEQAAGGRFCRVESKTQERSHPVHFSIKFTLESGIAWRRFNVSEL